MTEVRIKKLNEGAILPTYGSEYAAGADLYACTDAPTLIEAGSSVLVHTGIALELPVGYAGLIYARSGLATKRGLAPANKVGVVDCDYRGEVMVCLHNHSDMDQTIECGERIAQLVISPVCICDAIEVECLDETDRGDGGFGSTGKQ